MKKLLPVLPCLEMLALSVWIGGLIVIIAAVIPAVFNVASMEVGGRLLTRIFQGYDRLVLVSAAILGLAVVIRTAVPGAGKPIVVEVAVLTGMIAVALVLILYVNPETVRLQEAAFTLKDEAAKRTTYAAFFRYHWVARGLYLVNLALAILAMCVKVRRWA